MTTKRSVALVISRPSGRGPDRWLLVQRPADDPELPSVWGLPAGSYEDGESDVALVRRIGKDKLGVELVALGRMAAGRADRLGYRLEMELHGATIVSGSADVPQAVDGVTQYVACAWDTPAALVEGARRGSLCCRLALDTAGWRTPGPDQR